MNLNIKVLTKLALKNTEIFKYIVKVVQSSLN